MIRQIGFIIIMISIGLLSCRQSSTTGLTSNIDSSKITLDTIVYSNYLKAVDNESTFQFFLVAKIRDLNTGHLREICTKGDFLEGALHMEYKIEYDSLGLLKIENLQRFNKNRYFEFKDTAALKNLGLNNYTIDDLVNFEKSHNIDSLAKVIEKGKWSIAISEDKIMLLYAHSLFNRGILTGENNCFGGTLIHVEDKWIEERKKQQAEMKRQMDLIKKNKK
jgi:hypothetical protein